MSQKGEISGDKAVKTILNGLKEFDGMMNQKHQFDCFWINVKYCKDTFDINIVSKWGKGLQKEQRKVRRICRLS